MESISNEQDQRQANDFWQAEVLGQIYETNFAEMAQWIAEGALMPTDKVRRGNLRWLEAGKVPTLVPFFNAKEKGIEPPAVQTTITDGNAPPAENFSNVENPAILPDRQFEQTDFPARGEYTDQTGPAYPENNPYSEQPLENSCVLHPEAEAAFYCDTCTNSFCPQCPKSYGGTVKICPMCGAMCRKIGEKDVKKEREIQYSRDISEGFGAKDIGKAFSHPFKYKSSLIFGGVMYMLFTLGQSAAAVGGLFMLLAALFCLMLTIMLSFGVLANTVENFSQGKLETDFMPDFDDFNLWDDVVKPTFLSIAATLSSFGPFILILIIGFYLLISSMTEQMKKMQAQKAKIESPFIIDEQKALNQSDQVKKLLEDAEEKASQKRSLTENGLNEDGFSAAGTEDKDFEEINRMIEQNRKQELESVIGKTEETRREEFKQMLSGFVGLGLPLLVLAFAALLWGIFYYPAACAVAGYTRSILATLNPRVGIDTIKTLGADYIKILGVFILLFFAITGVNIILSILFLPLALPGLGNLPVIVVSSWFMFYFTIVFSCVLGYALYKNSDKFKFYRG